MYAFIKGTLIYSSPLIAIVENHGIGYQILIPSNLWERLPAIGQEICLYTSFVIREFSQHLYGFNSADEKDAFELLLTASGVGPKLALSILSSLSLSELQHALINEEVKILSKVSGIGKKTAERLILELKDKWSQIHSQTFTQLSIKQPQTPFQQKIEDAILALVNLGYHQHNAQKAVKTAMAICEENDESEIPLPTLITRSLKHL